LPKVTYLGPSSIIKSPDGPSDWARFETREVSQEWLEDWRNWLPLENWSIEENNRDDSEIPNIKWNRTKIITWLKDNDVTLTGYTTKNAALELVNNIVNQ